MRTTCMQCGQPLDVEFESSTGMCSECKSLEEGRDISELNLLDDDLTYNPDDDNCSRCGLSAYNTNPACFNHPQA